MPEFEQDPYGLQDFHEEQLKHYGLKKETRASASKGSSSPQKNSQRNEATGMPVPIPQPKRKPVPGAIQAPVPRDQSPGSSRTRTQSPEGTRLIFTRSDGRFDPSTIRTEGSKYTPPASPISERPTSSSSNKASLKRTDSQSSKSSWRSRRDSAGQAVRKLSTSLKEKAGLVAMDRNERVMFVRNRYAAAEESGAPVKSRPGRSGSITKGEQIALNISKAVDSMKTRGRRGTNDSDMSMGMTDTAPEGEMQPCVRCYRPIFDFATHGLCQQCHKEARTGRQKDQNAAYDQTQLSQGDRTSAESPERGYMKLPTARKILRLRQTIYSDPGNPFADEVGLESRPDPGTSIPTLPTILQPSSARNNEEAAVLRPAVSRKPVIVHPDVRDRPATGKAIPQVNRANRRSQSVALPVAGFSNGAEEYVGPRAFWRKESAPTPGPRNVELSKNTDDSRDTKFYGFYDDIIRDYKGEERGGR